MSGVAGVVLLQHMARNNAWSNHRLLKACACLSQEAFDAPRTGFFPSLKATLNHIYVVDLLYIDALEGGTLGPAAWQNEEPFDTVATLQAAQAELDRRLMEFCDALADSSLVRPVHIIRQDLIDSDPAWRVLLHLFQHQIHHRGQAHSMLSDTEVKPPQLDEYFLSADLALREQDLQEIGLNEMPLN